MDWRDSNIILGEQMNTRGYDSSKLLPSHKGVGILRPDGETETGAEVLAMTVRSHYMPNPEWRAICERGRALREAAGTLNGHAAGETAQSIDDATALKALGSTLTVADPDSARDDEPPPPEPLASVVAYLGDDLTQRTFVPTAELLTALGVEATAFGRDMGALGCTPRPGRITDPDGSTRQVRGYLTADLRAALEYHRDQR
jgi:S-DNA-T family DNA segregation ATPase FtsK/SpoIIIE